MAQTLSQALAEIGVDHAPSAIDGKRDWYRRADGRYLGSFDAHEGWALVAIHRNTRAA